MGNPHGNYSPGLGRVVFFLAGAILCVAKRPAGAARSVWCFGYVVVGGGGWRETGVSAAVRKVKPR